GGERDSGGEDAQVDHAQRGGGRGGRQLGEQRGGERQGRDRAGEAAEPRHGQGVDVGQQPLLQDGAARVDQRGGQAERDADAVGRAARRGQRDARDADERDADAGEQPGGEALAEREAREHRDEDRREADEERRGAGVQRALGGVE